LGLSADVLALAEDHAMKDPLVRRKFNPAGRCDLAFLRKAASEGQRELDPVPYAYAVRMAEKLRHWGDIEEMRLLRIAPVENFFELKLKGNVLGKTNIRVFFGVFDTPGRKTVVVLGGYKKEDEDELPRHIVLSMKNRRRTVEELLMKPAGKRSHS
jgi:hypothetical protein